MSTFSETLYKWHNTIQRILPWKETDEVFHIWLSEIILQQTRVEQGIPYYLKIVKRFPTVNELANAPDEEVMKLWEGLGYYSRARNMHKAAKLIAENGGVFPQTYKDLLTLPGVGKYTAAAIASFAYNEAVPVIDGNVNRVVARIFGILEPIDTNSGQQAISEKVHKIFDPDQPAKFNQAIMDFGAVHCTPKNPDCNECFFSDDCIAFQEELVEILPVKSKKINKKNRYLNYLIITDRVNTPIRKRTDKDIWRHLHEFILLEKESLEIEEITEKLEENLEDYEILSLSISEPFKHLLTHQNLFVKFYEISVDQLKLKKGSAYFLVERKNLRKFAFPKIIDWYLDNNSIS
jgi:A/G-specific adenine glycosylase